MVPSLQSIIEAWASILWGSPQKHRIDLAFSEDEVMSSFEMASKALEQKNEVIRMLEAQLIERASPESDPGQAKAEQSLSPPTPTRQNGTEEAQLRKDDGHTTLVSSLTAQLQESLEKLKTLEAENAELRSAVSSLNEELLVSQQKADEQEAAVNELAHMLAAREASQKALVETVNAFVSQLPSSLPATPVATPRGTGEGGDNKESEAKDFESMIAFWQERLEAQAAAASLGST